MSKYKTNKINSFIMRFDFASSIQDLSENVPNDLASCIKNSFPIFNERELVETSLFIDEKSLSKTDTKTKEWSYTDKEENNKLTISSRYLIFETINYVSFDKIYTNIIKIIDEIFKINNVQIKRTGIRYINLFEPQDFHVNTNSDWSQFLNNQLVENTVFENLELKICQTINEVVFSAETHNLKLRYGFRNKKYPIAGEKYDFIIDCDGFSNSVVINSSDLNDIIQDIHYNLESIFESCITQKMRDKLDEK